MLGEVRRRLGGVQTIALTATPTRPRAANPGQAFEREPAFVHGFDRPNLRLAMAAKENTGRQLRLFPRPHPATAASSIAPRATPRAPGRKTVAARLSRAALSTPA
jgi:superfamily II DNA helicase RecQ